MLSVDHCGDLGGCDGLISPLWSSELYGIQSYVNHIGGVMVNMFNLEYDRLWVQPMVGTYQRLCSLVVRATCLPVDCCFSELAP
jgi:hypothetical protein